MNRKIDAVGLNRKIDEGERNKRNTMKKTLLLASASPRRKEILEQAGFSFEILAANADENIQEADPAEMVKKLSARKALASMEAWKQQDKSEDDILVLGADTVVVLDGQILGKPSDQADATQMLRRLQGNTHQVYTGVTLLWVDEEKQQKQICFAEKTDVVFYPMTETEIQAYVATNEGADKAGSYAVQGLAMKYIEKIDGDYHNVVGLPAASIYQTLRRNHLEL